MNKKKDRTIRNINDRFDTLRNCYEMLLMEIDQINNELTNEYRKEKMLDKKGKSIYKHRLKYVDTRATLTGREMEELKERIFNFRYNNVTFSILNDCLAFGQCCNLKELIDYFFKCVSKEYEIVLEKNLTIDKWQEIEDHYLLRFVSDRDLQIKVLIARGVLKEMSKKENVIIEDLKPGKQLLLF